MISAFYIGLHGLLLVALSALVIRARFKYKIALGEGDCSGMKRAIRVQANFVEYVPLALMALVALELTQTSAIWLHGLGAALFVGRIFHAIGLSESESTTAGRFGGTVITFIVLLISSVLLIIQLF